MCGIALVHDPIGMRLHDVATALAGAMAAQMERRRVDRYGRWVGLESGMALGHRHRSIADQSEHGGLKMEPGDGRSDLAHFGEIYGRTGLARDLNAVDGVLHGRSNPEVSPAVAQGGADTTSQPFAGMFARGLWDRGERRLAVACFRMGEMPPYGGTIRHREAGRAETLR